MNSERDDSIPVNAAAVSRSTHNRFVIISLSVVFVLGAPLCANYLLLWSSGELTGLEQVIDAQINDDALYGTALHDVRREHKLALIRHREPNVVALGSSRALDFRQEYFTKMFACACQAMKSSPEGTHFVNAMMDVHRPELVLFAIDYWWLTGPERANRGPLRQKDVVLITKDKLFQPFEWLRLGKITYSDYVQLILGDRELAHVSGIPRLASTLSKLVSESGETVRTFSECGSRSRGTISIATHAERSRKRRLM